MREANKSGASVVEFTLANDRGDTSRVQTTATVNAEVVCQVELFLPLYLWWF
jgi:hypothetical protein